MSSVVDASDEHFVKTVDDDLLWVPNDANHTAWVTRLVCQLIHSRGVHDELLQLLTPVCKVKVSSKVMVKGRALRMMNLAVVLTVVVEVNYR